MTRRHGIAALLGVILAGSAAFVVSRAVRVGPYVHAYGGADDVAAFQSAVPEKFVVRGFALHPDAFATAMPLEDHVADLIANREPRDSAFAYVTVSGDPRDAVRRLKRARTEIEKLPANEQTLAFSSIVPLFTIDMCRLRDGGGPYATAVDGLATYSDWVFGDVDPASRPASAWVLAPCTSEGGDPAG